MSVSIRELTDNEWTIAIPARLGLLLNIYTETSICPAVETDDYQVRELIARQLIADVPAESSELQLTERGKKLIEMVLATPLPRHVWADPRKAEVMG